jgi:hypothetical protein
MLAVQSDHVEAIHLHRQALERKLGLWGSSNMATSFSYNALDESLMHLEELDQAENNIEKTLDIATSLNPKSDPA